MTCSCMHMRIFVLMQGLRTVGLAKINTSLGIVPGSFPTNSDGGKPPAPCVQADIHMNIPCETVKDETMKVLCALKSALYNLDPQENQL